VLLVPRRHEPHLHHAGDEELTETRNAQLVTFTMGLRYSLSRPIYETKGFEMKSNIAVSDLFNQRVAGAKAGTPVNTLLAFDRSGPKNRRPPLFD